MPTGTVLSTLSIQVDIVPSFKEPGIDDIRERGFPLWYLLDIPAHMLPQALLRCHSVQQAGCRPFLGQQGQRLSPLLGDVGGKSYCGLGYCLYIYICTQCHTWYTWKTKTTQWEMPWWTWGPKGPASSHCNLKWPFLIQGSVLFKRAHTKTSSLFRANGCKSRRI